MYNDGSNGLWRRRAAATLWGISMKRIVAFLLHFVGIILPCAGLAGMLVIAVAWPMSYRPSNVHAAYWNRSALGMRSMDGALLFQHLTLGEAPTKPGSATVTSAGGTGPNFVVNCTSGSMVTIFIHDRAYDMFWNPSKDTYCGVYYHADHYATSVFPGEKPWIRSITTVHLPYWMLLALCVPCLIPAFFKLRRMTRRQAPGAVPCAACGYDLRASKDRCPECGASR